MNILTPPGRFPGGFIKREGRPSEKEILTSRLIDRPIRPLFPEGFLNETQVIAMVLSADPEQDPNSLAIVGAAAALAISDIPFQHVLGGVRVGMRDGQYVANPTYTEGRESKLNIVVAGTEDGIVMVEAGAQQASEEEVLGAIEFGHDCCKKIAAGIRATGATGRQAEADIQSAAARPGALRSKSRPGSARGPDGRAQYPEVSRSWKATRGGRTAQKACSKRCRKSSGKKPASATTL